METKIIAAHAGLGKTTFAQNYPNLCIDLESSLWSKIEIGKDLYITNPDFPKNYIKEIKKYIGIYNFIFVSPNLHVQKELQKNNLYYISIYPTLDKREEYIKRYISRGSNSTLINHFSKNWEQVLKGYKSIKNKYCTHIETENKYLEDILKVKVYNQNFNYLPSNHLTLIPQQQIPINI